MKKWICLNELGPDHQPISDQITHGPSSYRPKLLLHEYPREKNAEFIYALTCIKRCARKFCISWYKCRLGGDGANMVLNEKPTKNCKLRGLKWRGLSQNQISTLILYTKMTTVNILLISYESYYMSHMFLKPSWEVLTDCCRDGFAWNSLAKSANHNFIFET